MLTRPLTSAPVPGNGNGVVPSCGATRRTVTRFDTPATSLTVAPDAARATAEAMLSIRPLSMSACVTMRVAVHVIDAPGASVCGGQFATTAIVSVTVTASSVTFPVFVTVIVYPTRSPTAEKPVDVVDFTICNDG